MDRKKSNRTSNRPRPSAPQDLAAQRQKLLETYFENGRQIANELVAEIEGARARIQELENDNARLRVQLRSDTAIRELLTKIEALESERAQLLSRTAEKERMVQHETARASAVEHELSNLASLYVASTQLHASLDPREVLRTIGQLLLQFVGAGSYALFVVDGDRLVPVASEGVPPASLSTDRVGEGVIGSAFMVGEVSRGDGSEQSPLVVVPMKLGDRALGAAAVYKLLEQKTELEDLDFELLRMVGTQGAIALAGAQLYASAGGRVPALSAAALSDTAR